MKHLIFLPIAVIGASLWVLHVVSGCFLLIISESQHYIFCLSVCLSVLSVCVCLCTCVLPCSGLFIKPYITQNFVRTNLLVDANKDYTWRKMPPDLPRPITELILQDLVHFSEDLITGLLVPFMGSFKLYWKSQNKSFL